MGGGREVRKGVLSGECVHACAHVCVLCLKGGNMCLPYKLTKVLWAVHHLHFYLRFSIPLCLWHHGKAEGFPGQNHAKVPHPKPTDAPGSCGMPGHPHPRGEN